MNKGDFLFEIGTEEIPAGYIANAIEKLKESFVKDLGEYKLTFDKMLMFSTPRRLAIKVLGLDDAQADETIERVGPARNVAVDAEGNLTKAGQGFLTGAKATKDDIFFTQTPKGEYIAVKVFVAGKPTRELLPIMMKNAIERLVFPKTMRWGEQKFLFVRPIRWLLALYDEDVIPFEFCSIQSSNHTFGSRYLVKRRSIPINYIIEYPRKLRKVKVIADRELRKEMIRKQLKALSDRKEKVVSDDRLLDIVTDLVEFPTAVKAHFDAKYLALPSKIITSTLSQNQKYFSTTKKVKGNTTLSNAFVFISNGNPNCSDIIKIGNEKVVAARLADAEFYFKEDTKKPLADYVEKLSEVVFQAKLGTLREKTERVCKLSKYICDKICNVGANNHSLIVDDVLRAAYLAKADLVTLMLGEKEFTKLQGYIGMHYALISGEKPEVAQAIYEHYMPRGQNDDLPSNIIGAIVAIADKLDTVCGIIGVGLMPTGSADPFAIRRAANGIVQIIDKYELDLSLSSLVEKSIECLYDKIVSSSTDTVNCQLSIVNFLKQRTRWLLDEIYHIDYDVEDALDSFDWDNIIEIKNRAIDLQSFKAQKDFQILVSGYKRVANILEKNYEFGIMNYEFDVTNDSDKYEVSLYDHLQKIKTEVAPLFDQMAYKEIMKKIVPLGADIDAFFDKVLVMCEDEKVRNNRLALLIEIKRLFLKVADISKISE